MLVLIYEFVKGHLIPVVAKKNNSIMNEGDDIREYCGVEKSNQKPKMLVPLFDPRKRIRKLYYKKVMKQKRLLIGEKEDKQLGYLTAKECCEVISASNLKNAYEKARYSIENVTSEDVRLANK